MIVAHNVAIKSHIGPLVQQSVLPVENQSWRLFQRIEGDAIREMPGDEIGIGDSNIFQCPKWQSVKTLYCSRICCDCGQDVPFPQPFDRVFLIFLQQIHERLDARQYVSYVPQPFGDGPRDRPDLNDHRWRKVKVRTEPGTGCKITSLGHALRLESEEIHIQAPDSGGTAISLPC